MSLLHGVRIGGQRPTRSLVPEGVSSAGGEAAALAEACGLVLDDWQRWCLDRMLTEDASGRWVASMVCLLVPRQNGKNAILEALELAAIFLFGERLIIHSAHLNETARGHMERMKALVRANPEIEALTRFYDTNGKERLVRLDTGAEIRFMTRGNKTLRGGSPDRIVFDEALELTDLQVQAIVPSLSAHSAESTPQMIYTSSAPLAHSDVLHRVRRAGLEGDAKNLFFAEWGCDPDVDPSDVDALYAVNPGLGIRITEDWVHDNERVVLPTSAFLVERLGVPVEPFVSSGVKIDRGSWDECAIVRDWVPAFGPGEVSFAVDVDFDGAYASIAVAAGSVTDPYVEVIEHRERTGWVAGRLVELIERWDPISVGINGAGPAGSLMGELLVAFRDAGIDLDLLNAQNASSYRNACGAFFNAVVEGRLQHLGDGQDPLEMAVATAGSRPLGQGWLWDRGEFPITPLVSATIAASLLPIEAQVAPAALSQMF